MCENCHISCFNESTKGQSVNRLCLQNIYKIIIFRIMCYNMQPLYPCKHNHRFVLCLKLFIKTNPLFDVPSAVFNLNCRQFQLCIYLSLQRELSKPKTLCYIHTLGNNTHSWQSPCDCQPLQFHGHNFTVVWTSNQGSFVDKTAYLGSYMDALEWTWKCCN